MWHSGSRRGRLRLLIEIRHEFSISLSGPLAFSALSGTTMVFTAQHFQLVTGLSALRSGLALLPGMVTSIVSVQAAPLLGRRIGPAYVIAAGLSCRRSTWS
jgi:DHA2 family multidrug resistance protein-like MFS transporter